MICKIYRLNELQQYKYVVVLSVYKGKIMLSRHKARTTWETQGGHIEPGETPLEAAKRELYEESGAVEFEIKPVCDYWAGTEDNVGAGGMVFEAEIHRLEAMPESEMSEIGFFDILPEHLTYPDITPVLYAQIGRYYFKKALRKDLDLLVAGRLEVLRDANKLPANAEMAEVEAETRKYYSESFEKDSNVTYLVYDGSRWIAAGSVSFYRIMPTYHNPSGKKAYIMNVYTHPDYRRKGIAMKMLELLVAEARNRGIGQISLEATEEGKPLYEKFGFTQMKEEMELL
jgi:ribosomal protein S18 acetylase RimI-like enzyme